MRVTLAQVNSSTDSVANVAVLRDAAAYAAARDTELLTLPEYASAYDPRGVGPDLAQSLSGPYVSAMREYAAHYSMWVAAGVTLLAEDEHAPASTSPGDHPQPGPRALNTIVIVDPKGEIAAKYVKVHLYDAFGTRESDRLVAGDPAQEPTVVTIGDVRVGVLTCYDLRFPESARRLIDAGAQVILAPAAWSEGPGKREQWELLVRARALENVSVVIGLGLASKGVIGQSLVAGPVGDIAVSMGAKPEFKTLDIDVDLVTAARRFNPSLDNRKYTVIPAGS